MSIKFACQKCGRSYLVDDKLAGRRVKCKGCGVPIAIPIPKPVPADDRLDVFGFDDEPVEEPVAPSPSSPRSPNRSRPKINTSGAASTERKELRNNAIGILIFGLIAVILPRFGLVLARRNVAFDPQSQTVLGLISLAAGAVMLALSYLVAESSARMARLTSLAGCVVLIVVAFVLGVISPTRKDRRAAAQPGPSANAPRNLPGLPNLPGEPPGLGPQFGSSVPGAEPLKITLSNGKAMRQSGPFGAPMPGVAFSVDYVVEGGRSVIGERVAWVIRTSKGGAKDPTLWHLDASGTLQGAVMTMTAADGPFETYLESESLGPGGPTSKPLSNTVPLVWVENPEISSAPSRPAGLNNPSVPGSMAPPGFPTPGRQPMGPPGGFGPRGRRPF